MAGEKPAAAAQNLPATPARIGAHVEGIVSSIGPKLQQLRQHQRLSLQQLAAKADVSAAAIHKIERSGMVPTITTLLKIAAALEHPVGYFIDGDDDTPELATMTAAENRPAVFTPHRGLHLAGISGPYAHFRGAAAVATVDPGADSGEKPLLHPGEELVLVTDGVLTFDVGGERFELGPGDSLHFVGDQPHHWSNAGPVKARAIWFALRDL
jgi:transcriptional regulator with XRE-family HTH domain